MSVVRIDTNILPALETMTEDSRGRIFTALLKSARGEAHGNLNESENTVLQLLESITHTEDDGRKKFVPPSESEVDAYCRERGNNVDAKKFLDFYTAAGWMRGKTKIKDWKACVRTWEHQDSPAYAGAKLNFL